MSKLRVAIVGCGAVARHAHVPAWAANPHAEIAACCDLNNGAIDRLQRGLKVQVPRFSSLESLLASEQVDIVDVCSPGFLHFEHTDRSIAAGCNVLVEKPPVMNGTELRRLVEHARVRGVRVGAVFNYRYRELVERIAGAAQEGQLGSITRINITHHGPCVFGDADWLWDEARSRYLLMEFGIHFIDILVHLLGPAKRILHVHAVEQFGIGHTTDLDVSVLFQSGAVGRLEIAADTTRHSSAFTRIEAYGTAQDCFVRWFPPLFRLRSGIDTPMSIIGDEIRSTWAVASKLARGEFVRYRNISHHRCIDRYVDWVRGIGEFPTRLSAIVPTIDLVDEISAQVPGYNRTNELV